MNLLSKAQRQLKEITAKDIKDLLKNRYPNEYSKMLIDDNAMVKRKDYYISHLEYTRAERKFNLLVFPLFEKFQNQFRIFTDRINSLHEQTVVRDETLIEFFRGVNHVEIKEENVYTSLDLSLYPFDMVGDSFAKKQSIFFFPKETFERSCPDCKGFRYVTCIDEECKGRHEWKCDECKGSGQVTCSRCDGRGRNRCSRCGGKGKVEKEEFRNGKSVKIKEQCSKCTGKGETYCSKCKSSGKVTCGRCKGGGIITCKYCYGDPQRKGMIDCPHCHTAGRIAQIKYLTTQVERQKSELFTEVGDKAISIKKKNIQKHYISNVSSELIYENINGKIKNYTDNISGNLLEKHQENLKLSKINYPLLLRAAISYQIIPVIKIEYKHFLTNETHSLIIVNFWDNPELIMTTNAEKLSIGIGSTFRYISNTFSKWFNTQNYKKKEDKRKEIKLMIYLIKADGINAEEEKQFLSREITSLSIFTNSEKKEFFNLMNATTLSELVKEDVEFSSEEIKQEVLNKLEEIANVDGSFDTSEKILIEKIRSL